MANQLSCGDIDIVGEQYFFVRCKWVGGTCPGIFWRLVGGGGSRKEANQLWFASLHTLQVSLSLLNCPQPKHGAMPTQKRVEELKRNELS